MMNWLRAKMYPIVTPSMTFSPMKSGATPARMMKPKYQVKKKIVAGTTKRRF